MRKLYLLGLFVLFASGNAQIINFPDANLKAKLVGATVENSTAMGLSAWGPVVIDVNHNGEIEVSETTNIGVLYLNSSNISDITGLEYFTNVWGLGLNSNNFTTLDISTMPQLKSFGCNGNNLQDGSLIMTGVDLQYLTCSSNNFTTLDLSTFPNLIQADYSYNNLTTINISGLNALETFKCEGNPALTSVTLSNLPVLRLLESSTNLALSSINLTNMPSLTQIGCSNCNLSGLDISQAPQMKSLYLTRNPFTTLDFSNHPALETLHAVVCPNLTNVNLSGAMHMKNVSLTSNVALANYLGQGLPLLEFLQLDEAPLTSLDVSGCTSLETLYSRNNQLTSLNVSGCSSLRTFHCYNNQITSLDVSDCINLNSLDCKNNLLTSLDVHNCHNLQFLQCKENQFETLNLKNGLSSRYALNTIISNPPLKYICVDDSYINAMQTIVDGPTSGYTNVEVNSYCSFVPGGVVYDILGNNSVDINNNGCDETDPFVPHMRYNLTSGATSGSVISDASGHYGVGVSAGTHIVTPVVENMAYYIISPPSASVSFPAQSGPFTQNFCIAPNGSHNDLEAMIVPMGIARPGFDLEYKIIYKNKGTTVQSGSVNLTFDDAIIDFVSALPNSNTISGGVVYWDFIDLAPLETKEIIVTLNLNSPLETPAVNANDILNYTVALTTVDTDETPLDNTALIHQTVVNSFDPNDKTCLEGTAITPDAVGKYVHYMIRFENTGTASAVNIVVKDMIDTSKFDIASLVALDGSHSFVTRISETNKVEFIFENINLPFDDANNDGYVVFKIKTKPSLVLGDAFSNSANIYFDYNAPIITNTATTTVANVLSNIDFEFSKYMTLYPNPVSNTLNIQSHDVTISSMSIYNSLGQLLQVITNANTISTIDVSALKTGNYFIKINSDKGTTNAKFAKN